MGETLTNVFISYAREDAAKATALANALEGAGHQVWYDRHIQGGSKFAAEINQALEDAEAVVVLWTSSSVHSAWVQDEAAEGRETDRLIPVMDGECKPPLGFRQYQAIDLSGWDGRRGLPPSLVTAISAKSRDAVAKGPVSARAARDAAAAARTAAASDARRKATARKRVAYAAIAGVVVATAGTATWFSQRAPPIPTVAVVAEKGGGGASLARDLAKDLTRLASARARDLSVIDAGDRSPVYLVKVGSERLGDQLRADLSLVATGNSELLWSAQFEQPASTAIDLRRQLATKLGNVLLCAVRAPKESRQLDQAAMRLFLTACDRMHEPADEAQVERLSEVTRRAPGFAPAVAQLALVEARLGEASFDPGNEESPRKRELRVNARKHFLRARELDPNLGATYAAESDLLGEARYVEQLAIQERGLAVDPQYAPLHARRARTLAHIGYMDEGLKSSRRAAALDPLSPEARSSLIAMLAYTGRIEEGWRELEAAERIWPGSDVIGGVRYRIELRYGNSDNAIRLMERFQPRNPGPIDHSYARVRALLKARVDPTPANIDTALRLLGKYSRADPRFINSTYLLALAQHGRVDEAFRLFEDPVNLEGFRGGSDVFFRDYMRSFQQDRRFMRLMARFGHLKYWQASGKWPDFCRDIELPYNCRDEARRLSRA